MLMADALGAPELALDPRFMSNDLRCQNRPEMVVEMEKILSQQPVQHWIDALNDAGVPCAPINTIDKLLDHPQLLARDMIVQVQGQKGKPFKTVGNPIKLSGHEAIDISIPMKAPGLGQHREALLAELMANRGSYDLPADTNTETEDESGQAAPRRDTSAA